MDLMNVLGLAVTTGALIKLLQIIAIDIILSGDNAVVIAMATRTLPKHQQNQAIFLGTIGAVLLRILFAAVIVYLLKIPFIHLIGGIILLWIAYKVLVEQEEDADIKAHNRLFLAVWTIIVADAVMSLDNVIAIAGASHGHIGLIALGVSISIPIMIFCSKMIVKMMEKYSWISYAGSGILAWTAGEMIVEDKQLANFIQIPQGPIMYSVIATLTILVLIAGYMKNKTMESNVEKRSA